MSKWRVIKQYDCYYPQEKWGWWFCWMFFANADEGKLYFSSLEKALKYIERAKICKHPKKVVWKS